MAERMHILHYCKDMRKKADKTQKQIVMLSGYMKSGKDTVGSYLCANYGFRRIAFADVLKDEVAKIYKVDRALLDTQLGKEQMHFNPFCKEECRIRTILIDHGMWRRSHNINHWVEIVAEKIRRIKDNRIVITDWRFTNEYSFLKQDTTFSIQTWRIDRWSNPPLQDISEISLDNFQFTYRIDNTGSVASLTEKIKALVYKSGTVPLLILDVDDVLLKWIDTFKAYVKDKYGYMTVAPYPKTWYMQGWLLDKYGNYISQESIQKLVEEFNLSTNFQNIKMYENSKPALENAKKNGYVIVALSSCTNDTEAQKRRKRNLICEYGAGIFDEIICLPLNASKESTLAQFAPGIFIDDNLQHVKSAEKAGHMAYLMKRDWNGHSGEDKVNILHDWKDLNSIL